MNNEKLASLLYGDAKDISFYLNNKKQRDLPIGAEVVRFAPSPTGYLHLGSFMSAYLDSLIAKSTSGVFYFRLEDTDRKRLVEGSDMVALSVLKDFGISVDEGYTLVGQVGDYGPYRQSDRLEIYHAFAKHLVANGRAYPCFCDKNNDEEKTEFGTDPCRDLTVEQVEQNLNAGKSWALRFRSTGKAGNFVHFKDEIKGERTFSENNIDFVLIKSNGIPVYHFAHIVDDFLMGTTLVVRGEEWFSTLPLHLEIFSAFGLNPPKYAHSPLIMKLDEQTKNERKISKRKDPEADMRFYLQKGYPVNAVKRYILTLLNSNYEPWQAKNLNTDFNEYPFELKNVSTSNPLFDNAKLDDISKNIIAYQTKEVVFENCLKWAKNYDNEFADVLTTNKQRFVAVINIDRENDRPRKDLVCYSQAKELYDYILPSFEIAMPLEELNTINQPKLKQFLSAYVDEYQEKSTNQEWFEDIKNVASKFNFVDMKTYKQNPAEYAGSIADAVKAIRYAVTGRVNTPTLFDIMKIVGREESLNRIKQFLKIQFD